MIRQPAGDPLWFKDAVIYETHVKCFYDSNGDGIGDFRGATEKLDYLEALGVNAVWLLPFYPSPLKDDGYDIANFFGINPDYGTRQDFNHFVREAHLRGIRVIIEVVLNHTSDQHAWFQRSRRARKGTAQRDYYVWSDHPDKYTDARIIFKDFEISNWTWDPVAQAYYWHRFYRHQPDLNYENPQVQKEMLRVVDHWLSLGVDGLRLDAVPYLFEEQGTNCENLPQTHEFLKRLRAHVEGKYKNRMILAEANQWPEDAVAYFGNGDECQMAFHFPLMPRIFMATWMEDSFPITDILEQTPEIPANCQWAVFLRNHDELTLEMVSDEERDYMYRVFARDPQARINLGIRRRLSPLLEGDRRKIELVNALLLSLPGTPIIYYGDEIGMGDNYYLGDRNGVRTPMQWSADRNAGFSGANPQQLYLPVIIDPDYHYESDNVDNMERNQASLLWWMRRIIAARKGVQAFGRGSTRFLRPDNPKVLSFIRRYQEQTVLVVANLSRFPQAAELDLAEFAGDYPEEIFSGNRFPTIGKTPYVITLNAYDYYWFRLASEDAPTALAPETALPELHVAGGWQSLFDGELKERFEKEVLPGYLHRCRWYRGESRRLIGIEIVENIPMGTDGAAGRLLFIKTSYYEGEPETYVLAVAAVDGKTASRIAEDTPHAVIATLDYGRTSGCLCDAFYVTKFQQALLQLMRRKRRLRGQHGDLVSRSAKAGRSRAGKVNFGRTEVIRTPQSNTCLNYGDQLIFKLFRRVSEGVNSDPEISRYLTQTAGFANSADFAGALEYDAPGAAVSVIGMLNVWEPNQGDAWHSTLDAARGSYQRALARRRDLKHWPAFGGTLLEIASREMPELVEELVGGVYLEFTGLLGRRTAEMHLALAGNREDPDFRPEALSLHHQRSLYQSMRRQARNVFGLLRREALAMEKGLKKEANLVLGLEEAIVQRLRSVYKQKFNAAKMRHHGNYHLGQILLTGQDLIIIDFEGALHRTSGERRLKRSPMSDVVSMIHSFHYAAAHALELVSRDVTVSREMRRWLEKAADIWYRHVSAAFLRAYIDTIASAALVPDDISEFDTMLNLWLLDQAVSDLGHELRHRTEWVGVPLAAIRNIMEAEF